MDFLFCFVGGMVELRTSLERQLPLMWQQQKKQQTTEVYNIYILLSNYCHALLYMHYVEHRHKHFLSIHIFFFV